MKKTNQEGVIIIEQDGDVIGMVRKDPSTHKNIIYSCNEMGFDSISELLSK